MGREWSLIDLCVLLCSDIITYTTFICPSPGTVQSTVAVGIVGADDKSGFYTWFCYQNPDDCTALNFDKNDNTGSAVNSILVSVPAIYPNVTIVINGYGQYQGMNKFLFGLSKPIA